MSICDRIARGIADQFRVLIYIDKREVLARTKIATIEPNLN